MVNGKFCVTPNAHCWKLESLQQIEAQMQQWQRKKEGMELMRHSLLSGGAWKINVTRSNQKNCFDTLNYYLHRKRYKTVGYVEVATK